MSYTDIFFHFPKILSELMDFLPLKELLNAKFNLEELFEQEYIEVCFSNGKTLTFALNDDDTLAKYGA